MDEQKRTNELWQRNIRMKILPGLILGGILAGIFLILPKGSELGGSLLFFMSLLIVGLVLSVWIISFESVETRQIQRTALVPFEQSAVIKVDERAVTTAVKDITDNLTNNVTKTFTQLGKDVGAAQGATVVLANTLKGLEERVQTMEKRKYVEYPEITGLFQDVGKLKDKVETHDRTVTEWERGGRATAAAAQIVTPISTRVEPARVETRRESRAPMKSAGTAPPLPGEVKEQIEELSNSLRAVYEGPEGARASYVMAPFWFACAYGLEQTSHAAVEQWKSQQVEQPESIARIALDILEKAATALKQGGYQANTNKMAGTFAPGGRPIDEAVDNLEKDLAVILKETSAREAFYKASDSITDLKGRLKAGDVALLLRDASIEVMEDTKLDCRRTPEGMAAWALIGYTMSEYMDRHLKKYINAKQQSK